MKRSILGLTVLVCLLVASGVFAQQSGESSVARVTAAEPASPAAIGISPLQQAAVPRLIKFNGTLRDLSGKPIAGPADVTFSLYAEESGGAPLWFETQTVQANSLGRYTVLLGAMTPAGVPMELFTSGEAHWLGLQVSNLPEQARVLLVSVPYALKAGDAETLGGKPASAYMLASQAGTETSAAMAAGTLSGLAQASALTSPLGSPTPQAVTMAAGYIPVFTDSIGGHGNSAMYQFGSRIGIGTTTPSFGLDLNSNVFAIGTTTAHPGAGGTMRFRDDTGTVRWAFGIPGSAGATDFYLANPVNGRQPFYIQSGAGSYSLYMTSSGNVGILTNSPSFSLDVNGNVIGVGTKAASPGAGGTVRLRDDTGTERWAFGIPGSAGATDFFLANSANGHQPLYIQAAAPSNALYLNASGNVGVGTAAPAHKLDVGGDINATGNVATSGTFSGNGSGLTSLTGANVTGTVPSASTASGLVCAGCVSSSEVAFNYAGGSSQGGPATSALTAVSAATATNALALGGLSAATYARQDAGNTFDNPQTITGDLTLNGTGNLMLTGTVNGMCIVPSKTSGTSQSANMLGGFTGLGGGGICAPAPAAASAMRSIVLPGGNTISDGAIGGTISGGGGIKEGNAYPNSVTNNWGTVAGGADNRAGDDVGPGSAACCEVVGGGIYNKATQYGATVGGGAYNHATYYHATVPGGYSNTANGWFSLAAGCDASAANDGSFVWSGSKGGGFGNCTSLTSSAVGQFLALAPGGFTFYPATPLANPVTIAASTGDIAAPGNITASGKVTAGSLAVDSATLVVDSTNNRVGVGTASPTRALQVASGDVYLSRPGYGIILKSPDGHCFRVTVGNTGTITGSAIACP